MLQATNSLELLIKLESNRLYTKLIEQLNKDLQMSNLDYKFETTIIPAELKKMLNELLNNLIKNNYDDYLNLLYRIDISEQTLLKLKPKSIEDTIEQITYLILKREAQKVWLKQNFST